MFKEIQQAIRKALVQSNENTSMEARFNALVAEAEAEDQKLNAPTEPAGWFHVVGQISGKPIGLGYRCERCRVTHEMVGENGVTCHGVCIRPPHALRQIILPRHRVGGRQGTMARLLAWPQNN